MSHELDELDKESLERKKLQLEIRDLRYPLRHRPSLWFSAVTAFVAVVAVFFQSWLSQNESALAEAKLALAELKERDVQDRVADTEAKLEQKTESLKAADAKLAEIERTSAAEHKQLLALRQEKGRVAVQLDSARSELEKTRAFIEKAKPELPEDLQAEADELFDRDASDELCGYEEYLEGTEELDHYQILYRAPDGRHFTWLWSSQDSSYGGVIGGEWLSDDDADAFLEDCRARRKR